MLDGVTSPRKRVETLGHELSGFAHAGERLWAVKLDLPGLAQRRERRIDVVHEGRVRFTGNLSIGGERATFPKTSS